MMCITVFTTTVLEVTQQKQRGEKGEREFPPAGSFLRCQPLLWLGQGESQDLRIQSRLLTFVAGTQLPEQPPLFSGTCFSWKLESVGRFSIEITYSYMGCKCLCKNV